MDERYEFRVVNADTNDSPSGTCDTFLDAVRAAKHRQDRWPEDGPQKIQKRAAGWNDAAVMSEGGSCILLHIRRHA